MYNKSRGKALIVAARLLNLFSALVVVLTGAYVEITFAELLSTSWKLVVAAAVVGHVVLHVRWTVWRKCDR